MRFWLLVVFVLQLCWNMAGFAVVGHLQEHAPERHAAAGASALETISVAVSAADVQATDGKGLVDQAHGLMDELPDLPDSWLRWATPRTAPAAAPAHTGWVRAGSPDPLPQTLLRPPQPA